MRRRASKPLLALVAILSLAACQDPDVGNPCTLTWGVGDDPPPPVAASLANEQDAADYFESGNTGCEHLICLVSPAPAGVKYGSDEIVYGSTEPRVGYCSKACISNDDCFEEETGLVCRQMLLDPAFLEQLDPAVRDRYLAQISLSSYCAIPR